MVRWEYRIVQTHIPNVGFVYGLHTVWFQGEDVVTWDQTPEAFYSISLESLKNDIIIALVDSDQPIYVAKGDTLVLLPQEKSVVTWRAKFQHSFNVFHLFHVNRFPFKTR